MMTQEQLNRMEAVRARLQDRRLSTVALETRLNYAQLWAFARGRRAALSIDQLERVERYFEAQP